MQFVGLLLIVNSLAGGAWWVATGRPQAVVVPICVAAMTAGVFLIIHDRTTSAGASKPASPAPTAELDGLGRQIAEAKAVLEDLQDQTAAADWHLKQLDSHIHAMQILPDGRTRIGNTVTGQAVVLIPKLEALQKLSGEDPIDTLLRARECVELYEKTREQMSGVVLAGGEIGAETVAWLYFTASTAAQRAGDHDYALAWARAAVAQRPTPERQCLLVMALINKGLESDANVIIQKQLKAGGTDAEAFRQLLDKNKVPYKRTQ